MRTTACFGRSDKGHRTSCPIQALQAVRNRDSGIGNSSDSALGPDSYFKTTCVFDLTESPGNQASFVTYSGGGNSFRW